MSCSVDGCEGAVKYKGLCGKHYKRQWRHGDANKTAYWRKEQGMLCAEANCSAFARQGVFCTKHYIRMRRYGTTDSVRDGTVENNNYNNQKHRDIAERALGHELPKNAIVHHHNGKPNTLVICPDQAYHMLLHSRMRRLQRGIPFENLTSY